MNVFKSYSSMSLDDQKHMLGILHADTSHLIPSIVLSWSNSNNTSRFIFSETWVLAQLIPEGMDPFWSLNSNVPISDVQLDEIITIIRANDPDARAIHGIPKITLSKITTVATFEEKPSDWNYIYDISRHNDMLGSQYSSIRREMSIFNKQNPMVREFTLDQMRGIQTDFYSLHAKWQIASATEGSQRIDYELDALKRLISAEHYQPERFVGVGIYVKGNLVGLTLSETLSSHYALNHYFKIIPGQQGLSAYSFATMLKALKDRECRYLNYQEDMGIDGLRQFKQKMRPAVVAPQYFIEIKYST